jgi:long-subunit acyl-CoA synthetase (AMP-forming)
LENVYLEADYVAQIFIHGRRYRPLVAVVVVDYEQVLIWAQKNAISHDFQMKALCQHPQLQQEILNALHSVAVEAELQPWEFITAIRVLSESISHEFLSSRNESFSSPKEFQTT